VIATLLCASAVAVAHAGPAALASSRASRLVRVHRRLRNPARVALTFDDGPQPAAVDAVLALLDREHVRATFFLVGERAAGNIALVREIARAGHELGNHGFAHRNGLFQNPFAVRTDIARGCDTIAEITGTRPELYRPPYGVVALANRAGAWRAGQHLVLWSHWARDWRSNATPASIARKALAGIRGADILLLHDADYYGTTGSWRKTLAALPFILDGLRCVGLTPSPIGGPAALA
jgi:peptidoglycan-N-acetylglucosamine deacetylase